MGFSLKKLLGGSWSDSFAEGLGLKGNTSYGYTVGNTLNNFTGSNAMYDKEYAGNVALWKMQNEYNSPAAQISRMKAAGIDVNPMTYAVGNGSMSTTASNISSPSVGAAAVNPVSALVSVMNGIADYRVKTEEARSMKAINDENAANGTTNKTTPTIRFVHEMANFVRDNLVPTIEWGPASFPPPAPGTYTVNADDEWNARYPQDKGKGPFKGRPFYKKYLRNNNG